MKHKTVLKRLYPKIKSFSQVTSEHECFMMKNEDGSFTRSYEQVWCKNYRS